MVLSMMSEFMKRIWLMELECCLSSIRISMGYTNDTVRVYVDILGPLYVIPGPIVVASTYI